MLTDNERQILRAALDPIGAIIATWFPNLPELAADSDGGRRTELIEAILDEEAILSVWLRRLRNIAAFAEFDARNYGGMEILSPETERAVATQDTDEYLEAISDNLERIWTDASPDLAELAYPEGTEAIAPINIPASGLCEAGELYHGSEGRAKEFRHHAAGCPTCQAALQESLIREIMNLMLNVCRQRWHQPDPLERMTVQASLPMILENKVMAASFFHDSTETVGKLIQPFNPSTRTALQTLLIRPLLNPNASS